MNGENEVYFVNNFFKKKRRDRLIYELTKPKKRKEAIGRFCHNSLEYIDTSKIIYSTFPADISE